MSTVRGCPHRRTAFSETLGCRVCLACQAVLSADEPESAFQSWVIGTAERLGWLVWHDWDSRKNTPGLPDLLLVNPWAGRVLFVELKTRTGKFRAAQARWADALTRAGADFQVWRPADRDYILGVLDWQKRGVTVTA